MTTLISTSHSQEYGTAIVGTEADNSWKRTVIRGWLAGVGGVREKCLPRRWQELNL